MRRQVVLVAAIIGLAVNLIILDAPSAMAKKVCDEIRDTRTGEVTVICKDVEEDPGGDNSKDVDVPPPVCRAPSGEEIDCNTDDGYWHAVLRCYIKQDPSGDGWLCTGLDGTETYLGDLDLSEPPPDPRRVAWELVAQANLRAGQIGLVPDSDHALLGMPTWMWVADPGPHTTGPIRRSSTRNGYTVTIEADLSKVVYDMGDGSTVTCAGPDAAGTRYRERYGLEPSPTCGHTYEQPGTYTVTARSSWTVWWYGVGQAGSLTLTLQRSMETTVKEGHVVIR